jgi:hypothetical protein
MATERMVIGSEERRTGADRRAGRSRFHVPERRLGYDRRSDPSPARARSLSRVRSISESSAKAAALMVAIIALNVADIALTFRALGDGRRELNPVMAGLLDSGHGIAAFVKIAVTSSVAVACWWFRRYRRVVEAAVFIAALMSLVVLYHVFSALSA